MKVMVNILFYELSLIYLRIRDRMEAQCAFQTCNIHEEPLQLFSYPRHFQARNAHKRGLIPSPPALGMHVALTSLDQFLVKIVIQALRQGRLGV